jgi:hypothetical protein
MNLNFKKEFYTKINVNYWSYNKVNLTSAKYNKNQINKLYSEGLM